MTGRLYCCNLNLDTRHNLIAWNRFKISIFFCLTQSFFFSCKCVKLLSNRRSKRHGLLLLTLVYDNHVKLVAIPGLSRDQFHMTRFG